MKKYIKYIGILGLGLAIGWLIFGTPSRSTQDHNHEASNTINQQWTCSMHPQILQPEAGDCPICGMDLIPADSSVDGLDVNEFTMTRNAMALANIETTIVSTNSDVSSELVLTGKIKENEKNNAIQTAHFGGRIEKLFVNTTGEKVNKGQRLALIYSPELVTTQKELMTAMETIESNPTLYNAVKNKLKLWKLSDDQIQKIETSKEVITNFLVYANVDGVVTMKMVEEGNHIKEGQGLFMIANLNTVWADFDAYEKQFSSIKKGDEINIVTNANPHKNINARISFIDPILNTKTRTVTVRAELNNQNGALKPGMFVKGVLTPQQAKTSKKDILTVPKTAVLWTGKRSVVYVKKQGEAPVFEMRNVTLGNEINEAYEILEGLDVHEEIVTNGTFTVDAAAQLQGKKSMMNPTGGDSEGYKESTESKDSSNRALIDKSNIDKQFKRQLGKVVTEYIKLKNAFTDDNALLAQKEAKNLSNSLEEVNMLLLDSNANDLWMKFLNSLKEKVDKIHNSEEIATQRDAFLIVSKTLLEVIKIFGIETKNGQALYLAFCPMADNNNGGFWLSYDKEIRNPYFGNEMLTCGSIQNQIN
jgi:Cu(I)/Ag(I) efflux system membrane fusion protein